MYDTLTIKFIPSLLPGGTCPDGRVETVFYFGARTEFEYALSLAEATLGVSVEKGKAMVLAENDVDTDYCEFVRWLCEELGVSSPDDEAPPSPASTLTLLRAVAAAKIAYWDAMNELEDHLTSGEEFTDHQDTVAHDFVDMLAAGGEVENIGASEAERFEQAVAVASIAMRPSGMPAAMAAPYGTPGNPTDATLSFAHNQRPAITLSYEEFAKAYDAHMRAGGTGYNQVDVDSSWHAYQRDPAGHFISKHPLPGEQHG